MSTLTYETEVAFYRDLADTVDVSCPHCYFAEVESGTADVVVVMEDVAPAEQGDQIAGCTVEQAMLAIDEAARLHGPRWGDPTLQELAWLDRGRTSRGDGRDVRRRLGRGSSSATVPRSIPSRSKPART